VEGGSQKQSDLVAQHGWLVSHIAYRLKRTLRLRNALVELEQMGMLGLLEAARRFDEASPTSFNTYAYYRIRGAILDEALAERGIKRSQAAAIRRVRAMGDALEGLSEVAEPASDMDYLVHAMTCATTASEVMESVIAELEESEELSGYTANPEEVAAQTMSKSLVRRLMGHLPEEERELLEDCYFSSMSLAEHAERVGKSRSWACRAHARALLRLRELMASASSAGEG